MEATFDRFFLTKDNNRPATKYLFCLFFVRVPFLSSRAKGSQRVQHLVSGTRRESLFPASVSGSSGQRLRRPQQQEVRHRQGKLHARKEGQEVAQLQLGSSSTQRSWRGQVLHSSRLISLSFCFSTPTFES